MSWNLPGKDGSYTAARPRQAAGRYRSIRMLLLVGTLVYAAAGLVDWFMFEQQRPQALVLRGATAALMLAIWSLAGFFRTSQVLARLVLLGILVAAVGQALLLSLDPSTALAALPIYALLILTAGPLWTQTHNQVAGLLACVVPPLAMLAAIGVDPGVWVSYLFFLGASGALALTLWRQRLRAAEHAACLRAELERQAVSDALTGVLNRGGWYSHATVALAAAQAKDEVVSLIYFDLDHFKEVNDRFGHAVGDSVIERTAALIRAQMRAHDLVARLGGEEFVALLPGAQLNEARAVAERVRETCREQPELRGRTISAGIAERRPGETLAVLMARADAALLHAKASGRDRVMAASLPAPTPPGGG